jgi:hypothetical protein
VDVHGHLSRCYRRDLMFAVMYTPESPQREWSGSCPSVTSWQ